MHTSKKDVYETLNEVGPIDHRIWKLFALLLLVLAVSNCVLLALPAQGPLRVHPSNPRYFQDGNGNSVYLTGSHTWNNLQDWGGSTPNFDFNAYVALLNDNNHNFVRGWVWWESYRDVQPFSDIEPEIYKRTGPGNANDGKPKFDLNQYNQEYFDRLKQRVDTLGNNGIYVSVMMFHYYSVNHVYSWDNHPYNSANNINGIDGDVNQDGIGLEIYDLNELNNNIPEILKLEQAYVRKVIDTLNEMENVLWEIANEMKRYTLAFQYYFIDYIHSYETEKPYQHPVGLTSSGGGSNPSTAIMNSDLFSSPADWVSPHSESTQDYSYNPPAADGSKVVISDTDHLGGILGTTNPDTYRKWVWKTFMRGNHPIIMDPVQNGIPGREGEAWSDPDNPALPTGRQVMGHTLHYARKMNLNAMTPQNTLCSTSYCLASQGEEYLIYQANSGQFSVNLSKNLYYYEWFNPRSGNVESTGEISAPGGNYHFSPPFSGDAVLFLSATIPQ